jgi:GT2 family glycosyltransferase
MRVAAAIPTRNRPELAAALLRSLCRQTWPSTEVLVVDQSDDDRLRAMLPAGIRYVHVGWASLPRARNLTAQATDADVVLYLDDDMRIRPDLVERHARHYSDPQVVAVGGRITGGYDVPRNGAVGRLRWDGKIIRNFASTRPGEPQFLPGGNVSIRRDAILACGGFDERFGGTAVGEETDFFLRLRRRVGGRLVYDPAIEVEHLHARTGGCRDPDPRSWTYWMMHNVALLGLRHLPPWSLPVLAASRVARAAWLGATARRSGVLAAGLVGLLRGCSSYVRSRAYA